MKRIIEAVMMLAAIAGCSVKEDRIPCHCLLCMDMSSCLGMRQGLSICLNDREGTVRQYHYPEASPSFLSFEVARGPMTVCVMSADPSDGVFACLGSLDIRDEFNYFFPRLKKQFTTIDLDPAALLGEGVPYTAVVSASSDAIDPLTLRPSGSPMSLDVVPGDDGCCRIRVPRQDDYALKVTLSCPGGISVEVQLGEILRQKGFDWTAGNLPDLRVELGRKEESLRITVIDWDL